MIIDRLEQYLRERDYKIPLIPGLYYASQLSFNPEKIEEIRQKYQQPTDISLLKIFRIGHIFHDFIQRELFWDSETEVSTELKIFIQNGRSNDKIKIVGRADIVLDNTIIELKTTS